MSPTADAASTELAGLYHTAIFKHHAPTELKTFVGIKEP